MDDRSLLLPGQEQWVYHSTNVGHQGVAKEADLPGLLVHTDASDADGCFPERRCRRELVHRHLADTVEVPAVLPVVPADTLSQFQSAERALCDYARTEQGIDAGIVGGVERTHVLGTAWHNITLVEVIAGELRGRGEVRIPHHALPR